MERAVFLKRCLAKSFYTFPADITSSRSFSRLYYISYISLQNYALALDRTGTSDRFRSLLATTLVKDIKLSICKKARKDSEAVSKELLAYLDSLIIDKNKIQRERSKFRRETRDAASTDAVLKCISYNGKKDKTLKKQMVGHQVHLSRKTEEHITIVNERGSTFVGYATPVNVAISCDGTALNTGHKTGVNACMEKYLQRPLQWNVCLFHFNELPLKALLNKFCSKQVGPGIWPSVLGSELLACNQYPVASSFEPIRMGHMPDNICR